VKEPFAPTRTEAGSNYHGQTEPPVPNGAFVSMAAGWEHSVALRDGGTVLAWGDNRSGQAEEPVPNWGFVAVASGGSHSLAL
jgi:alpha-tubulin suppressor-like RCC1 family protein